MAIPALPQGIATPVCALARNDTVSGILRRALFIGGNILASNRLQRTNEDIKQAMSVFLREIKDPRVQQGMVSVTGAETTADLKYCKIYLSVYGLQSEKELMRGLRSASGWLRHELAQRVQLRVVPELTFQLDRSMENGAHIDQILRDINQADEERNHDTETEAD